MPEEAVMTEAAPNAGAVDSGITSSIAESQPAVEETQPVQTDGQQTPVEGAQPSGEQPEQRASEDGRVIPKWIRDMQKANPKGYQQAKNDFFSLREFRQVFPSVADARQAKEQLELVGGTEGLSELQTTNGEFKSVAQQFFDGDPAFVDDLANEDPLAFGTHVPHTLDKFKEIDEAGYNREMARRITGEHDAVQLRQQLVSAYQAIKADNKDEALRILYAIAGWHDRLAEIGKQEDDPRFVKLREELKTERQQTQANATKELNAEYRTNAEKAITEKASALLDSYLAGRKIEPDDRNQLMQNVMYAANSEVLKDANFQKQLSLQRERAISLRNSSSAVRFAVARYEQALKLAVERQARLMGVSSKAAIPGNKPAPNGNKPVPKAIDGFEYVTQSPPNNEIDRSQTTREMVLKQRAVLKGGRKVTWAKNPT